MIKKIEIDNFKLFKNIQIPSTNLNIFTGLNAMGKSTVIQSLLLLRQSYQQKILDEGLYLNGDIISIGQGQDCINRSGDYLGIQIEKDDEKLSWKFGLELNKDFLPIQGKAELTSKNFSLFDSNFQYVAAEHLGPSQRHDKNTNVVERNRQISLKYGRAEYTIHFLEYMDALNYKVIPGLKHEVDEDDNLHSQLEYWLREISPGVSLKAENKGDNFELSFEFISEEGKKLSFKPQNVGFALSYSLPYIVAILTAQPGSLLLLENPEAHLHPHGQAKMAELICKAARCGVQIFLETHSDHIINEILVQLKEHSENIKKGISITDVNIFFLEKDLKTNEGFIFPIEVKQEGKIINPPENFFNQFRIHMRKLW